MKKQYSNTLLSCGIALILTQIAAFVLQNYFDPSVLTLWHGFDIGIFMVIAFLLIIQVKSFQRVVSILLIIYGGLNLLHGITASNLLSYTINNMELEVLFVLGLLLGYALFEIAALFTIVSVYQKRFSGEFTRRIVLVSLGVSLVFLALVPFVLPHDSFIEVIRTIATLIGLATLYVTVYFFNRETYDLVDESADVSTSKDKELENLYQRGLITEEEYNLRKERLNS